ncbi:MAG TPA: MG2 domain-containing protein [Chthonomonadaceae bacterium]|nr:MG2 domain-containing protein [Chthonomonadaceae bacterium]
MMTLFKRLPWLLLLFAVPAAAQTPAYRKAHRPNIDLYVYRRSYLPDEKVSLRLSVYNTQQVTFTAYQLGLPALTPTSRALENFGKRIKAVDVSRLPSVRTWRLALGKIYPDQWMEKEAAVPKLVSGVYLIRAVGGGVEKRTWLAITPIALLAKRSLQELLIYATQGHSGRPIPGLSLTAMDAHGRQERGVTDAQGLWRATASMGQGNLWIYGARGGAPAFVLAGAPPAPEPFTVYLVTDRPIYRPGHRVRFKGVVRQRLEAAAPGGFVYRPYANKSLTVEIRDATDALVYRRAVTTNAYGSFDGDFQLASEPTLGRWQLVAVLGDTRAYGEFQVEAYRKPEFSVDVRFPQPHALGGSVVPVTIEARYYFGQPTADAAVQYTIAFQPEGYTADLQGRATPEPPYNGQGVTDANGQLQLQIKTQRLPMDRRVVVRAVVTDLSRRSQQGEGSALITAGLFHLTVSTDKALYRPDERVTALVHAEDYDGKPVATKASVRLIEMKTDRLHRPYQETTTRAVTTNARGDGTAIFQPPRPGYLQLIAEAFDSQNDKIQAQSYVWVAGAEEESYTYPTLNLIPERAAYRPGEVATILLNTSLVTPPGSRQEKGAARSRLSISRRAASANGGGKREEPSYAEAWALVTVEGERLYRSMVVPLTRRSTLLRVPLEENYFPSVEVSVTIVQEKQIYEQQVQLQVAREQQKLSVSVTPDKDRYQPGEAATYTVTTRDYRGRPVPAELSFGVVDASIYAIQPDTTPDISSFFYGGQQVRIQTDFSFAAEYSGGAFQTVPGAQRPPGALNGAGIRVRRQFADTAYWNPFVLTDGSGTAKVTLTLPDNLTTWRTTARGITLDTAVGSATNDVVATMPLLVRLELPRFYVQGDEAVVSAIVHNYTGASRTVTVTIQASGADLEGDGRRTLDLAPGTEQRLDWKAHIHSGSGAGQARFLVTADGGPGAQDATELTLPVLADGVKRVESRAEVLSGEETYRQDLSVLPPDATLTLALTPSVAGAVFEALDYLTSYPYGCAEQTMSAFLPDVIVARALRRLGISRPVHPNLNQWVNLGLQKLYRYQHQDGGWNWWEFDQSDGDMTAYVLWGLLQAREAGYLVDDQRILRGTGYLKQLLQGEREENRRAEWLLTLAYADPKAAHDPLAEAYKSRDRLDTYALASLGLALERVGGDLRPMAVQVAHEIETKAKVQGTTAEWPAEEGGYTWRDDDVMVTARALRAVLAIDPNNALVLKAVRWLMGNREGQAWSSTRSSAEAVFALTQYMEQTHELHPDFRAVVHLDGQKVQTFTATAQSVFAPPVTVTLTPAQWHGHAALTVDKQGAGVLYVTATSAYTVPSAETKPLSQGITVHRTYQVTAEDPSQASGVPSGEEMEVGVEITADANYRYVLLEDPIPAGCEVAPTNDQDQAMAQYENGGGGYARQEVRDDRVAFFFDDLPKGRTRVVYRLHAETPGLYRILPSLASLMYFPEIRGNGTPVKARIEERNMPGR